MASSLAIAIFAFFPVPITQHRALFGSQLDEFLGLLECVAGRVPPEAEQVQPSLKLVPGEPPMRSDEPG